MGSPHVTIPYGRLQKDCHIQFATPSAERVRAGGRRYHWAKCGWLESREGRPAGRATMTASFLFSHLRNPNRSCHIDAGWGQPRRLALVSIRARCKPPQAVTRAMLSWDSFQPPKDLGTLNAPAKGRLDTLGHRPAVDEGTRAKGRFLIGWKSGAGCGRWERDTNSRSCHSTGRHPF